MEALDSNLYASLLSALADNLSSSRSAEIDLLTAPLHDLPRSTSSQDYSNGPLPPDEVLTLDQCEGIIAFAEYVLSSSDTSNADAHAPQIINLVESVRGWILDDTLGARALKTAPTMDRLTHAIVRAALAIARSTTVSSTRSSIVASVFELHAGLLRDLDTFRNGERLVVHTVPATLGLVRAIKAPASAFRFSAADPYPAFPPSSKPSATLAAIIRDTSRPQLDADPDSDRARALRAVIAYYEGSGTAGLTSLIGPLSAVELLVTYWSNLALATTPTESDAPWSALAADPHSTLPPLPLSLEAVATQTAQRALETWEETVTRIEAAVESRTEADFTDEGEPDPLEDETIGAGVILDACLRLATVTTALLPAQPSPDLIATLESLLLPSSLPIHSSSASDSLQLTALQSIRILSRSSAFAATRGASVDLVREFLMSPELGRWSSIQSRNPYSSNELDVEEAGPAELVRVAAETWIALLPNTTLSRASTLQTLLNHLSLLASFHPVSMPPSPSETRDSSPTASVRQHQVPRDREISPARTGQAINAVHAIGILAREPVAGASDSKHSSEPLRLAQSALQRLVTTPTASDALVIAGIGELALIAETLVMSRTAGSETLATEIKSEFREIGRTVGAVGRGAVLNPAGGVKADDAHFDESDEGGNKEDAVFRAAVRALDKLGQVAAQSESELGDDFLIEVLTLFVHRGTTDSEAGQKFTPERRSAALAGLLPVIASYLRLAHFSPTSIHSSTLSALFRSFWYICLLSGLFSRRQTRRTRTSLTSIAQRAPPLVLSSVGHGSLGNGTGSGDVWVEIEAQINGALKNNPGAMSIEAVRGDLATAIPSQAGSARSVSAAQAVFLATILRLETLRAEAGVVSPIFEYLKIPSLAKEAGMGDCLKSIGEKVLTTYISTLSRLVPDHAVPVTRTTETLCALLYRSADPAPEVRSTALSYLNELFPSFPSLLFEKAVVTTMLELLTVLRRSCFSEFLDEYTPTYTFSTAHVSLTLPDDYPLRQRILRDLHSNVRAWLKTGLTRSPEAMKGLLMHYIEDSSSGTLRMPSIVAEDEMGKSVALDMVRTPPANGKSASLPAWGNWTVDSSATFASTFAAKSYFGGEAARSGDPGRASVLGRLEDLSAQIDNHKLHYKLHELRDLFFAAGGHLVQSSRTRPDPELLHLVVSLPVRIYTEASINAAQDVWTWIVDSRSELEGRLIAEVVEAWSKTIEAEQGLFSRSLDLDNPLNQETQFTPTDKAALTKEYLSASRLYAPMTGMLDFLSSRFQAFRYRDSDLVLACMRLVDRCLDNIHLWTHHALSRELRFRFLAFGFCIVQGSEIERSAELNFRNKLYDAVFDWFSVRPAWSFGTNRIQIKADLQAIEEMLTIVENDFVSLALSSTSSPLDSPSTLPQRISVSRAQSEHDTRKELAKVLLSDEADRLRLWLNPTQESKRGPIMSATGQSPDRMVKLARFAWRKWPKVTVHLPDRFKSPLLSNEITELVRSDPLTVQDSPHALAYFLDDGIPSESRSKLRHLLYWAPVAVPEALRFLFPKYQGDPILLQYALRVLEHHPVGITFFYIPQVVQALRTDALGYAERFIFETSKISQLFCHQIIWNMKANAYRGDDAEEEDPMKPTLDRVVDMIVESLSGEAQDFYNREFSFFDEVTSISAKLKPFIKSSKAEKKAKIDEEMAKIKVDVGVYLPSNPDGVVVDVNRKSGRPLQSHAKAPFMATFKVRRQKDQEDVSDLTAQDEIIDLQETDGAGPKKKQDYDTWQSAIFKVGDDCRQDVLALQIIAMHKNIFNSVGLDLLVTPYRVTATGPGCGVIDVVPNATSRDEMGRAKINDLLSFFTMKYGPVESIEFQKARTNFIQSMAAYSLLCYIIQIKDRHNGNIMVDGRGCITHIDFGFLFDIGPGGIKFEPNSFKLSHEMIVLMGGGDSPGYRMFVDLTIKAFLACRQYAHEIVHTTSQMLSAEFPSFKGEPTMDRLLERFRLDLSEKDAAKYMISVIKNAYENRMSIVYDEFQRITNGIPYTR
ncbi:1-phosphatidylinositol 4-kinase STT4 [Sporobolomyces koalae]|uniref:1-phosphatidylinositol 4-kinase STT4 n=1 Tax=Sporobolomyces koalae TaxID=500713 RepID=UPI00317C3BD1